VTTAKREPSDTGDDTTAPRRGSKRRYEKPRLVDYGAVSKLTQGGGLTVSDGGSGMKMPCL
jgi:hypothetical protein